MILHNIVQGIFLVAGIVSILAATFNWNWFFMADNCQYLVKKTGRNGARCIYGIAGLLFIAAAVYFYIQVEKVQ